MAHLHAVPGWIYKFISYCQRQGLDPSKNCTDCGYNAEPSCCHPDYVTQAKEKVMGAALARQKSVDGQLKSWNVLHHKFWHCHMKQHFVFQAMSVVEQIKMKNKTPAFKVDHVEDQACFWDQLFK
eukprot:286274-Ditylum_brightwellii.AAC.1